MFFMSHVLPWLVQHVILLPKAPSEAREELQPQEYMVWCWKPRQGSRCWGHVETSARHRAVIVRWRDFPGSDGRCQHEMLGIVRKLGVAGRCGR
jgi:hypothetical protein